MGTEIIHTCFYESGKFSNGSIASFRGRVYRDQEYKVKNDAHTCYDGYYRGEDSWGTNFKELFTDIDIEIFTVIDKKGKKYSLGEYAKGIEDDLIKITEFYIRDSRIHFRGVVMKTASGVL